MKKSVKDILFLVRFGSEHRIKSLHDDGDVFFNTPESYRNSKDPERGDKFEGAEWIENTQLVDIKVEHPELSICYLTPEPHKLSQIIQFNDFYLSHSLYALTGEDFKNSDSIQVDKRMLEFGTHALLIFDPFIYLDRLYRKLKKEGIEYEMKFCEYVDFNKHGKLDNSPYHKTLDLSHQNEFRIVISDNSMKGKNIALGSLKEASKIVTSQQAIELVLEVKRANKNKCDL